MEPDFLWGFLATLNEFSFSMQRANPSPEAQRAFSPFYFLRGFTVNLFFLRGRYEVISA